MTITLQIMLLTLFYNNFKQIIKGNYQVILDNANCLFDFLYMIILNNDDILKKLVIQMIEALFTLLLQHDEQLVL